MSTLAMQSWVDFLKTQVVVRASVGKIHPREDRLLVTVTALFLYVWGNGKSAHLVGVSNRFGDVPNSLPHQSVLEITSFAFNSTNWTRHFLYDTVCGWTNRAFSEAVSWPEEPWHMDTPAAARVFITYKNLALPLSVASPLLLPSYMAILGDIRVLEFKALEGYSLVPREVAIEMRRRFHGFLSKTYYEMVRTIGVIPIF